MTHNLDELALAAHAAMIAPPPYVQLANALLATDSRAVRGALMAEADLRVRDAAVRFAAEPEGTRERDRRLSWLRADPRRLSAVTRYYSKHDHIPDFIADWMMITDPRRIARKQTALTPFSLWPAQRQLVLWMLERWHTGTAGCVVKGRDVGASTVGMATLAALCIFENDFAAGILSATEAKLDRFQDTLFMKLRGLLRWLPPEFNGGYDEEKTSTYLAVSFPRTRSSITGATGSNAFRGLRLSYAIVDEAAHLLDSQAIDSALSAVTDVRVDISTPCGIGGSFYQRAHNPAIARTDLTWRDDPRRNQDWYDKQVATLDPVVLAQEVNADFSASREGVVIPAAWVQSAIGLAEKLGITPKGARYAALDVGDTSDLSVLAIRHGVYLEWIESWSGAGSDLMRTAAKAFRICDERDITELYFDEDGLGASMRGDARVLNERRKESGQHAIRTKGYRGSSSPVMEENFVPRSNRTWADLVANRKAQAAWHLRMLFQESHKAATGEPYDKDGIICINPRIPELARLIAELSQPTMTENAAGRLLIDKLGDGERSPGHYDSTSMVFAPRVRPIKISAHIMEQVANMGPYVPTLDYRDPYAPTTPRGGSQGF